MAEIKHSSTLALQSTAPRVMPIEAPAGETGPLAELARELRSGYPLTPPQQMGLVVARYSETLAAALSGDAASIRDFPSIARTYIQHAREYDPGSWQAIKEQVKNDVGAVVAASTAVESKEDRQARRYQLCVDAGLKMPDNDYASLPRGVGKIAEAEGIARQSFAQDVKGHIRRLRER